MYHSHYFDVSNHWTTQSSGKRLFDVVFSGVLLVLFLPVFAVIAVLLKCADRGPVVYAHTRVGKNGEHFPCYKFRTMVSDADARLAALLESDTALRDEWLETRKLRNDPRIIPGIGFILRKTSLDELPQILNVFLGHMSIVGPRPIVDDELRYYGVKRFEYLSVRPGLTGPWQSSERSDSTYDERVKLDVEYVRFGSLWKDIWIVLVTARKFLGLQTGGAY